MCIRDRFVDGAMEMEDVETDGEKIVFTESGWKKAYQAMEEAFPKRTIQGWFLCGGPGSQLSPLNYWKQHCQYFAGKNQLMYLNHGLEGEAVSYTHLRDLGRRGLKAVEETAASNETGPKEEKEELRDSCLLYTSRCV